MKKILEKILYILAKAILIRYKPKVIGITGSVGKTSCKEAIYTVLKKQYKSRVRRNLRNYNNEIGVPLTIIGSTAGGKNIFKWFYIFGKAILMLFIWRYPKILILEMGADRPGDIKYLTKLAPCYIGILTAIGTEPSHLENFKNVNQLVREKSNIVTHLKEDNFAVINIDDKQLKPLLEKIKAEVMTIGETDKAALQVSDISYSLDLENALEEDMAGLSFKVNYEGNSVPFKIANVLGTPQAYAALNAVAAGLILKMNLVDISEALKDHQSPKGRMNLLKGIKETVIIDDTYNSSPLSSQRAFEVLNQAQVTGRKIVCLGNMEELGEVSKRAHRNLGRLLVELDIDILFAVGDKAKDIAEAAQEKGLAAENIFIFEDADKARKPVQNEIHRGDVILIKGSQDARMEKITKEIMAEPLLAKKLLIRQDRSWK